MKKIILSFIVLNVFNVLMVTLSAQTPDHNYHPYPYAQEELLLTSFGFREIHEKAAMATALMTFGIHEDDSGLKEQSVNLLDEICVDASVDILGSCIFNYFNLGDSAAINFFNAHLEKEEYRVYAALFLAQLGEHKTTFPIFAEALSSDDEYEVHTAIIGLAAIGTEEALDLITKLPPEKNRVTLRERLINFNHSDIKKGDEL